MTQNEVIDTVLKSDALPTLPFVASKLLAISSKEDTTINDIANLVAQDTSLSTKILKVVNSSFYGFPGEIASINKAVSILGTRAVRSLVLSFSLLKIKPTGKEPFDYESFWEKSLAEAVAAKLIITKVKDADPEEIFIAGLLQNLGKMLLARAFPEKYIEVQNLAKDDEEAVVEAERKIIGADHCIVGASVAKSWGFPQSLLYPILHHHNPESYKGKDRKLAKTIKAVYLSSLMANIFYAEMPDKCHKKFVSESKRLLGFSRKMVDNIYKAAHTEVNSSAKYFGLKTRVDRPIEDILQEANIRLSQLNLSYEQINRDLINAKMDLQKLAKELKEKNEKLEKLANMDGLTEVYNHRYFQTFLDSEINRSTRNEKHVSLILADVDNFKKFNDTYGHQVGDFILKELCIASKKVLREYDLLARYGGEEFVFVLPETDIEEAQIVGEKIRETIAKHSFKHEGESYSVTMSLGLASMFPSENKIDKNEFIVAADRALLTAKRKGKNRVEVYTGKNRWFGLGG